MQNLNVGLNINTLFKTVESVLVCFRFRIFGTNIQLRNFFVPFGQNLVLSEAGFHNYYI